MALSRSNRDVASEFPVLFSVADVLPVTVASAPRRKRHQPLDRPGALNSLHAGAKIQRGHTRQPVRYPCSLPNSSFLPNLEDCVDLRSNYAVLLGRELVHSVPFFKQFAK